MTASAPARAPGDRIGSSRITAILVGLATAFVIVALVVVPFLSPAWIAFEQDRAEARAWTGYTETELRAATDAIVRDLVIGPPAFDVVVGGEPVLNERERGHMRDVRTVFAGLLILAIIGAIVLLLSRRLLGPRSWWRAVGRGATGLAIVVVALGVVAVVAFDALFSVFHRLLFAGGSYTFDPATERLVQLFPFTFWQETAIVVGAVIVLVSLAVAIVGRRRSGTLIAPGAAAAATVSHTVTEPGA